MCSFQRITVEELVIIFCFEKKNSVENQFPANEFVSDRKSLCSLKGRSVGGPARYSPPLQQESECDATGHRVVVTLFQLVSVLTNGGAGFLCPDQWEAEADVRKIKKLCRNTELRRFVS